MITFEEQLQQTENDNSIIGKKSPKVQTLSDVANTGVYSDNDWIELPETKATSGEIIREGLRASQYQLSKIPTELKATMGQAMMSPESVLKIIPFTSMPTMITEQAKVKIFGGTKEADFNDFTGKTRVKQIGKELVQAAYRELKEKDKQYAQRATPLTEEETDTWKYGIASGIGNYGPMLAIGYLTGGVGALSFAVAQEAGQKTEEKIDYYAQKTGDTELKGYTGKQAGKDLALTSVYTAGMGIMEKYIGIGKQMKLFKMSGGEHLKNIALTTLSEGLTEGLEDLYASGIDLVGGYIDTSKLPERYMQAVKSAVIGGLLGGTAGIGTAMAHRSQAKLILRKQYEKTIPAKDIDKVVNAIYDSTADTLQKVVATELVNSESLRNKHGELYNSLKREISNQIKASGAYSDVDEMKLSQYIEGTAKMFADQVLGEANKRGVVIDEVLKSSEIAYKDGRLYLQGVTQDEKAKKTKRKKIQKMIEKQAESILNPRETELSYEEIVRKLRYEDLTAEQETNLQEMLENEEDRLRPLLDTAQDVALEIDNNFGLQLGDIASVITEKKLNFKEAQDLWGDYLPYNDLRILGEKIKERDNKDGDPVKIGYDYYTEKVYDAFDDINAKANNYILLQQSFDVADENARLDDIYPEYKGETITINGKERTVYNSNGDRIAKSKEALENFYRWFGDSKVVDEQGRPLVVYHGTNANFDTFDNTKLQRTVSSYNTIASAYYFTSNNANAQTYGSSVYPVYLNIKKPLIIDYKGKYFHDIVDFDNKTFGKKGYYAKDDIDSLNELVTYAKEKGYDGLIAENIKDSANEKQLRGSLNKDEKKLLNDLKKKNYEELYSEYNKIFPSDESADTFYARMGKRNGKNYILLSIVDYKFNERTETNVLANDYIAFENNQIKSTQNRGTYSESENIYYQSAFAGSRVDYDRPSLEAIGSGEGNQAHGWGLYYALNRDVAERYRETFTKGQSKLIIGDKSIEELINSYDWNNEDYDIADNMIDEITRHLEFRAKNQKDTYEARQSVLQDIGNYIQDLRGYLKKGSDDEVYIKHVKEDLENAEKLRDKIATYNAKEFKFEEQKGQVHEVDIPENPYLLDEDATYFAQPEIVRNALDEVINNLTDEQISKEFEGTVYPENRDALRRMWKTGDYDFRNEGGDIYKSLSKMLGSPKAASQMLEKYGIKGITYDGRQDGRCFVIFNPEDVRVIQKFYQINHLPKSKKETIKGSFDALTKSIKITSDADFSTYQHEFAHFWLDNMFNYAHSDLASENYKKDFKAIEKWLKYDDTRQSYLTRQQHEQFARGYEKFLYKGEVANPIIGKAYNDYENFIREVYSSMTEIDTKAGYKKYKPVPAKVYEFFNNMVRGELPNYGAEVDPKAVVKKEVEDTKTVIAERNKVIAENKKNYDLPPVKTDNTSGYISETAKPKNIKPIENIEDKSVLTAYAKTMGEDMEAGRANLAKDYATATEFVNKNPELAGQIVRGEVEAPTGMLKNSIYMAYNELQKKLGNTKNRAESALNQALELRRYGQEIASQRLAYMSEINPEYWIGRILTSKASQLAKENRMSVDKLNTTIKEAIESGMAENKTPKEIAKELREELGVTELYQTEIAPTEDTKSPSYNYIYKYVNEQLGLGMKEADAMEILRRTDDMWANIENSKAETGNPSIEYFEKLKALEDFANTLAPSSNLRVFVSVISPGSLLLNIKSSLTNIISNLPTGLMRAAVRRIRLGQMTSLVSPEKIALNKHYVWEVFAKTGYNITDMTELTPESKYHGEEITHSQGKGALRALGRWYEKVVYKWSLGAGDIFYKNLAFNDYASLLATKLANGDAKVANDLFDDAIRIEPLTQYGKAIRRMARDEALIATYQNDTALSKSAMKLRDATDFGVGLSKFFIPFVKTPANVIDLGLKTGFGSFKAIVSEVHRDMKAGKILKPTKENIELCIENGLGFALGFALSSMFDDDDYMPAYSMASAKDKQLAKELNIPFNSVRIGDTWFNLDYLGPLAVPLVGILNARREKDIIEKIGAFGKSGLMQIAALPAFGEIDDLMQKIEQYQHKGVKESAEQFVDNLGETIYSRIVPSIVNDVAKVLDGYDRERKGNEIITQIPFARENVPMKYNVTSGRPEEINQWWGIFTGARVKTQVVNSVAREFERLNNTGNGVSLTPVTRSGLLSSLSDNKKQQVNKEFAKEYAKQVSALIKTYKYKNSNDEDKKDMIDKIRRKIVKELKQEYLQK